PRPPRPLLFPYTTLFRSPISVHISYPDPKEVSAVERDFLPFWNLKIRAREKSSLFLLQISWLELFQCREAMQPSEARGFPYEEKDRKSTRLNSSHVKISY